MTKVAKAAKGTKVKPALSHIDAGGRIRMVDVGDKPITSREAVARGSISMSATASRLVREGQLKKGDPVQAARLAGIMAAKRTPELIPLCHPLQLSHVDVEITPTRRGFDIEARVRTAGQTGVEMEALTAVAVASLTLYDMVKAVDKEMEIGEIRLVEKRGGRSGEYKKTKAESRKKKKEKVERRKKVEIRKKKASRTLKRRKVQASRHA